MEFKLAPEREIGGSYQIAEFRVSPKRLVEVFGKPPLTSDDGKQSGIYVFEGEDGCLVTLYDWKVTNLYIPGLLSPEQYWTRENPLLLNIGSTDDKNAKVFFEWLQRRVEISDVTLCRPEL
jgi:hypothetical protein